MRRILELILLLLIASGLLSGAFGASAETISPDGGAFALVEPDGIREFTFTPSANGLYGVYLLPEDAGAQGEAVILLDGEEVAAGAGSLNIASLRMVAGAEYVIRTSCEGAMRLEIARETLSRSFSMPLELPDGGNYSKLIARGGDAHWYSITARTSGAALLVCAPETENLRMQGMLFSADGRLLDEAETLASGTAVLSAVFSENETYLLRLTGYDGGVGKYALSCLRSENTARPESVRLSADSLQIDGFSTERLDAEVFPADACPLLYLDSSHARVAQGFDNGFVEGRSEGLSLITAYAFGGARSTCRATVSAVPVQAVQLQGEHMTLVEGGGRALVTNLMPANTTQRRLTFSSSDEDVLSVDKNGVLTALREGEAVVTVSAADGAVQSAITVIVEEAPPQYRALLIGQQEYLPGVETVREGSVKSVESLLALLNSASFDGGSYSVATLMDAPRDGVISAIRRTFASAREDDTSLIYITCHGFYQAGMTFFLMADGSVLSASDLERELRAIPGEIILLVDCCSSGGVLAEAGSADDLLRGVTNAFYGVAGPASIRGSKYRVIASAFLDQDSYRLSFPGGGTSTVFARALCDAAGWNMDRMAPSAMNADKNYDSFITMNELSAYLSRRVMWYLRLAGNYTQSVCAYPSDDPTVVFARTGE